MLALPDTFDLLPIQERDRLIWNALTAHDLARIGRIMLGYQHLCEGMRQAQAAQERGEVWGNVLLGCYLRALERYTREHGHRFLEEGDTAAPPGPGTAPECEMGGG